MSAKCNVYCKCGWRGARVLDYDACACYDEYACYCTCYTDYLTRKPCPKCGAKVSRYPEEP